MQIVPPLPIVSTGNQSPLPTSSAVPHVQAAAAAPIIDKAITPATKSERGRKSRASREKPYTPETNAETDETRGKSVNLSV